MKLTEIFTLVGVLISFVGLVLKIIDMIKRNKEDRS